MSFDDMVKDLKAREARARAMGGPDRLARREAQGLLNARKIGRAHV